MSEVVDHLAELTGFRDRDVLDVTLVGAFRDLLRPDCVTIYRPVGESGQQRWLTRARLRAYESTPSADSVWVDLEDLPALDTPASPRALPGAADGGDGAIRRPGDEPVPAVHRPRRVRRAGGAHPGPLTGEQTRLVSSILRVYRNFQGLLDYSERDTLTGLLNRKTFDGSFLRVVAQGDRRRTRTARSARKRISPETFWLGVADIDHFKLVNDTHGHLIGDEVLLLIARLMRSSFRFQDQLYRFGGEEFVVLLRGGNARAGHAGFRAPAHQRCRLRLSRAWVASRCRWA
jgi:GGDEF domain-containing protein